MDIHWRRWLAGMASIGLFAAGCMTAQQVSTPSPVATAGSTPAHASAPAVTQAPAATLGPSGVAGCFNREAWDILRTVRDYSTLTPAQIGLLVTSLKAYDYGTNQLGADWRDRYVAALERGDMETAFREAGRLIGGVVEPRPCPS